MCSGVWRCVVAGDHHMGKFCDCGKLIFRTVTEYSDGLQHIQVTKCTTTSAPELFYSACIFSEYLNMRRPFQAYLDAVYKLNYTVLLLARTGSVDGLASSINGALGRTESVGRT